MGKLLVVLLGLGAVSGAAYHCLSRSARHADDARPTAPARQLQNVRDAAGRIEDDSHRRAEELMEKSR
jgi:hypothetical protein